MTRLPLVLTLALVPATAFAHPGPHLHPHGVGYAITTIGVASIVAAVTWLVHPWR